MASSPAIAMQRSLFPRERSCLGCGGHMKRVFVLPCHSVYRCDACTLYALRRETLEDTGGELDREHVVPGLRALRERNYRTVLDVLRPWQGGRLLDVGCSAGLFLASAQAAGFRCHGIEPDPYFRCQAEGIVPGAVAAGHFPADLPSDWHSFDVITFHDVLEHLPDPIAALSEAKRLLNPGGVIAVSLPVADGFAFRLGCLLGRMGIRFALQRLFQVGFPYPHWFYFSRQSLARVAPRAGLQVARTIPLASFSWQGMWDRARTHLVHPERAREWARLAAEGMGLLVLTALQPWVEADNALVLLQPPAAG